MTLKKRAEDKGLAATFYSEGFSLFTKRAAKALKPMIINTLSS
ncbi:hypothetical protein N481_13745 [Pseudoalteromonas luteoviolacea S4047-1]|uniref:Uncharacterized protein n=1 Tax=Pseudoalteromonas luteoviolacea S4054 TaxID=1129367 RepID=A0A0F6AA23_9GAMM|nr:hypothetical protein N479_16740 [Pseudoalteromonas luteoviolacea S4054]KZN72912.1 hypothetical protein N481_13745 [Pseudoalteromonas luteoviolacea S4047-1]